jgi:hypothetical protein
MGRSSRRCPPKGTNRILPKEMIDSRCRGVRFRAFGHVAVQAAAFPQQREFRSYSVLGYALGAKIKPVDAFWALAASLLWVGPF